MEKYLFNYTFLQIKNGNNTFNIKVESNKFYIKILSFNKLKLEINTKRLLLRRINTSDATFILELVNSMGWLKYIGNREVQTISDAESYIQSHFLDMYDKHDFGFYCVIEKTSKNKIGICGITKRPELDFPDLGYALLENFAGKGFALEASLAVIEDLKEGNQINKLLSKIFIENSKSITLIKKLGFELLQQVKNPSSGQLTNYYEFKL